MVGVEAIGIASSITAFVDILSIIIIFDMSLGMKRPLGISVSSGNYGRFKQVLGYYCDFGIRFSYNKYRYCYFYQA